MSVKIVSQQNYYHELRENMEPKNMSGFCELTREDAKEIDGGHDRAHRNHNRLTGSRKSAASAQWTTTGWAVSAIGVALAVPSGGTSIAFASLGAALATGSLVTMGGVKKWIVSEYFFWWRDFLPAQS